MQKIILSLLLLVSGTIYAQDYNLNNYKYRFQKFRYAQFNFNFKGNNSYTIQKSTFMDSFQNSGVIKQNTDENRINLTASLPFNYYRVINTETLQHDQSFNTQIDLYNNSYIRNKDQRFSTYAYYNTNNRFYKGMKFTELNAYTAGNYANDIDYEEGSNYYSKFLTTQVSGNYNISVGKGKGRLEYVTDAVTTMFLLKDLKAKAGIGNYTNEQIESIAKGITKINTTRFIDFRFRLIDQLTLLDSTLKNNGILTSSIIPYFTTINDNWLYASKFQRYSGKRWSVNFINRGSSYSRKQKYKYADTSAYIHINNSNNNLFNGLEFNYSASHQASLFVQHNFDLNAGAGLNINTYSTKIISQNGNPESKNRPDEMRYYLNLDYGYLFQPNTRTYLMFNLQLNSLLSNNLFGLREENPADKKRINLSNYLTPSLNLFRFISPRFYYNLSVYSNINATKDNQSDISFTRKTTNYTFPLSVNMGLTYTFF